MEANMTTPPPTATAARGPEHEERFGALRTLAAILKFFAYLVAILGTIVSIIGGVQSFGYALGSGLSALIGGLLLTAISALILFVYAEIIRLGLAIEHNTFRSAEGQGGRAGPLP
jgi:hypothetical protein